jgi:hypothetical protein
MSKTRAGPFTGRVFVTINVTPVGTLAFQMGNPVSKNLERPKRYGLSRLGACIAMLAGGLRLTGRKVRRLGKGPAWQVRSGVPYLSFELAVYQLLAHGIKYCYVNVVDDHAEKTHAPASSSLLK